MNYVPKYGGAAAASFDLQFPNSIINPMSFAVCLIESLSNDGNFSVISHGTGFFWRKCGRVYLVTARHVLSGRNPFDDSVMGKMGYIPENLIIHLAMGRKSGNYQRLKYKMNLLKCNQRLWIEDPEYKTLRTDIAIIPIDVDIEDVHCLNDYEVVFNPCRIYTDVGSQCFVVGYPTTHVTALETPVWRLGVIASEPKLPIDHKPIFLVDAATGPGFSGSPVFRVHYGPAPMYDKSVESGVALKMEAIKRTEFIGVYSGRLDHKHFGAQTPYVFYGNRVPIIAMNDINGELSTLEFHRS